MILHTKDAINQGFHRVQLMIQMYFSYWYTFDLFSLLAIQP